MRKMVCHGDSLTETADLAKRCTWPSLVESRLKLKTIKAAQQSTTGISADAAVDDLEL